jgi:hypothetical protein
MGPSFGAHKQIFLSLFCQTINFSSSGASSLMRGQICKILVQFNVIPESKSRRTDDTILLSHVRLPQPRGTGLRIYIPQKQGGPVIPPGTGFPFCLFLRPAGTTVEVLDQPAHGVTPVKVVLRLTVSRPVCLGVRHPSGSREQYFLVFLNHLQTFTCLLMWRALSDERSGV